MKRGLASPSIITRRPDPLIAAMDRPIAGTLLLRPNFDHWLRFDGGGVAGLIHHAQMARMEKLFAAARAEMEADSHRTDDRLHMHPIKLGEF
jgi:hypothetical protein